MKKSLLDILIEMQANQPNQQTQPLLNLNNVDDKSVSQVTQGLQNIVKTKDQLIQQQKQLVAKQNASTQQQQSGPGQTQSLQNETETMTMANQDKTPMGRSPENSAKDGIPVMEKEKIKENFVDSKMFSIIAENETPKITKKEFIDYIKTKKI